MVELLLLLKTFLETNFKTVYNHAPFDGTLHRSKGRHVGLVEGAEVKLRRWNGSRVA
jgi:hypothetical protein